NTYQIPDLSFIKKIKQSVNRSIETVLRFSKIFESLIADSTHTIESILEIPEFQFTNNQTDLVNTFFERYTPKVQLATFLQSFLHRQNSVRREAVESEPTKYYEPFSESTADIIISNNFNEYVTDALKQKTAAIIKTYSDLLSDEIGMAFWQCKDVEEAAGIILLDVKFRGHFTFARIIKALQRRDLSLAREKIEMVVYGTYKGVKLFKDKPKNPEDPESIVWSPSRTNVFRIINAQKKAIPEKEFWLRVMPANYKGYIESYFEWSDTLKNEDSSKMTDNNILQLIGRFRGAEIVHEKVSIAEQSDQTTINIDVEELKEIAIVLEDINKTTKDVKLWVQNKTEEISEEKLRFTGAGKERIEEL
ncbi:2272_t:CDS:2, partial [Racocetra fulgida]